MPDNSEPPGALTDYDRIGGAAAVSDVVQRFYELVLADERLAPFFADVDMSRLKRHQALLISQVLGGPSAYDGRDLREAHQQLEITHDHFTRVVAHLVTALEEFQVPPDIIRGVTAELAGAEQDVVTAGVH